MKKSLSLVLRINNPVIQCNNSDHLTFIISVTDRLIFSERKQKRCRWLRRVIIYKREKKPPKRTAKSIQISFPKILSYTIQSSISFDDYFLSSLGHVQIRKLTDYKINIQIIFHNHVMCGLGWKKREGGKEIIIIFFFSFFPIIPLLYFIEMINLNYLNPPNFLRLPPFSFFHLYSFFQVG